MMKKYVIDPKISQICATFLKINIGEYLISKDFRILLKERNLENLWELCREIRAYNDNSGIAIFSHGYTGYAEETFEIFLNELYNGNKKTFLDLLKYC